MRLNRLAIQGFKSFATKTEFLFPTGITAIVGPNGSGKSNIADAISWVLGEQRMRILRAKSTADMIFAGGRRRVRAGMAEVSLTLDNSDGWLPIDFSEVTITRRAYRSGENEYLLNRSKVRLRDTTELLAESGLSQRTYSVIGQGLVDAALSLRPQERRTLFEDAAGISYHRSQREDAIRRLDETQHNLERVYDIINEITPRLQRLRQDAEHVEEHRRFGTHLERLQRTWYGHRWGLQQVALDRILEVATALERELEARRREESAFGKRLIQLRQQESDLRARLRDWHRESANLHDEVNDVRRELAVAEERARLLEVRREELQAELGPLSDQLDVQIERVKQAEAQVGQSESELVERKRGLAELEQEWTTLEAQVQESVLQRTQVEQGLLTHRGRLERLNQALLEARAGAARLVGEQEALNRLRAVETVYDASVQALLQANLDGVLGPLAMLVRVPRRWKRAIEVGLDGDLQAVVVERAAIVEDVLRTLESTGGRLTLLPLDSLRPAPSLPSDVLSAADVVICGERVRPAVEAVLGSVALCDDVQAAYALLPAMPPGSRCATATGIVLRSDGALSVGEKRSGAAGAGAGLLADESSRQQLLAQVEQAQDHCRKIEERQRVEAEQVAALESNLAELNRQAMVVSEETARVERDTVGKARTQVAVAEEALRSHRAALQREMALLERLQAQMSARSQRVEDLKTEHAAIVARIQELRSRGDRLEVQQGEVHVRIQPAEEELTRLRDGQVSLEERERQARERVREMEARQSRAQLDVVRHRDELKMLSQRIEEDLGLVELELSNSITAQAPLPLRPLVSRLPVVEQLPEGLEEEIQRLKARLHRLGAINPNAPDEYAEVQKRHSFLTEQSADLETASAQLRRVVAELDELMAAAFLETFEAVAEKFSETFTALFDGGSARLELTEPDDLLNTGVDIIARPPGKRAQRLALLSGGERALTAVALLFAILRVSPAPFCVLDEVDAMLDEANIARFRELLEELSQQTQFVVITHNRGTIEVADTLYGISMGADAVSQVVSLELD